MAVNRIAGIDHVVLVARDITNTVAFYREVLGLEVLGEAEWRRGERRFPSLRVGAHMLNVHQAGEPVSLEAANPQPASEDLCFVWDGPIEDAVRLLRSKGVTIELGPVTRRGARGTSGTSVYFRDPDGNLLELMSYETTGAGEPR
jgi:catechol 2,3-dioxygenase-like lactoylglutathione lyase family enzyme